MVVPERPSAEGVGTHLIARILTAEGYLTKRGGSGWSKSSVTSILSRFPEDEAAYRERRIMQTVAEPTAKPEPEAPVKPPAPAQEAARKVPARPAVVRDTTVLFCRSRNAAPGTLRRKINPPTQRARLDQLKVGDVVMQRADHPVVIVHIDPVHNVDNPTRSVYGRYVWADLDDPSWILGDFKADRLFWRAV